MLFAQNRAFRFTVFIAFLLPQYSFCNIIQFIAYPFCHLHIFHQIRISEKFLFHNTLQCINVYFAEGHPLQPPVKPVLIRRRCNNDRRIHRQVIPE